MNIFLATFGLLLFVVLVMAVGYIFQRKTLAGSCGGMDTLGIEKACDCEKPCAERQQRMKKEKIWQDNKII